MLRLRRLRAASPRVGSGARCLLGAGTVLVLSGCVTVNMQGQSSRQTKRAITETYFYKNTAIFYPDGLPADPASLPDLGAGEVAELKRQVRSTTDWLRAAHGRTQGPLERIFDRPIGGELRVSVDLTDTGRPVASIGRDGTISLDAKVIQAMFRAALVSTFETEVILARLAAQDTGSEVGWSAEDEQRVAVTEGLALKKRVDDFEGKSMFGDLFSNDTDLRSAAEGGTGWFAMQDLGKISNKLQQFFTMQQAFLLAHEIGHVALGHHDQPLGRLDCDSLNKLEGEADVYAVLLLTLATPGGATADLLGGFLEGTTGTLALERGLDALFGYAFEYAGFGQANVARCAHPERAARLEVVKEAYDLVRSAQQDAMIESARRE